MIEVVFLVIIKYRIGILLALISCLCFVLYSYSTSNKYSSKINVRKTKRLYISATKNSKISFIFELIESLACRLDLITSSHSKSVRMAITILSMYVLTTVTMFSISIVYTREWYMTLLNLVIACVIPFILIRILLSMLIGKALKQLPRALDELESAFYRSNKLRKAIEIAYPIMPIEISRIFKMLYTDMLSNELEAIEKFKLAFNNEHINSLCVLFKVYVQDGGTDITQQLQQLNSMIHDDITAESQGSSKLMKYKILAIITLLTLPLFILLSSRVSPDVLNYYTNNVTGSNLLSLSIVSTVIYYLLVEIIERL